MINDILAANLKYYIDLTGAAEKLTPEKSVFQISVKNKKEKTGWHYIINEGKCLFKRGIYTGEIFIDWNDEFKYKEKSKKQIKLETTPDYEVIFKDEKDLEEFVDAAAAFVQGVSKRPKLKSSKLSGSKCRGDIFEETLIECFGSQKLSVLKTGNKDLIASASRMALYALAEAFNHQLKNGDEAFVRFASGSRKSYFFGAAGEDSVWLTTQDGLAKVTPNQGTRLPPLCGLEFRDRDDVLNFVYGDSKERGFGSAYVFKGAATYGSGIDTESLKRSFMECCLKAADSLKN
jgi:hypothetical protein